MVSRIFSFSSSAWSSRRRCFVLTRPRLFLFCTDLSNGLARSLSMPLAGIQIDGIWHTSIVLRSREIYYGQGIQEVSPPGTTHHGQPVKVVDLGETELEEETFEEYLNELRDHYRADKVGFSLSLSLCLFVRC